MADETETQTDTDAAPAWHDSLPDDLRADLSVQQYVERNDLPGLVKSYVHAQKSLGQKPIGIPGENATDEERAAFAKAFGVPDEADGYEIKLPDGYEPSEFEKQQHPEIQKLFHEAGLSAGQASKVMDGWNAMQARMETQLRTVEALAHQEAADYIQRHYRDTQRFSDDVTAGLHFVSQGDTQFTETVQNMRLSNGQTLMSHGHIQLLLARIGGAINEDPARIAPLEQRWEGPDTARQNIEAEYKKAFTDQSHPLHINSTATRAEKDAMLAKIERWSRMASGG